jgi:hypothetical protein
MSLLSTAVLPEHATTNGLNVVSLAVVATPFLLRPEGVKVNAVMAAGQSGLGSSSSSAVAFSGSIDDEVDKGQITSIAAGE